MLTNSGSNCWTSLPCPSIYCSANLRQDTDVRAYQPTNGWISCPQWTFNSSNTALLELLQRHDPMICAISWSSPVAPAQPPRRKLLHKTLVIHTIKIWVTIEQHPSRRHQSQSQPAALPCSFGSGLSSAKVAT